MHIPFHIIGTPYHCHGISLQTQHFFTTPNIISEVLTSYPRAFEYGPRWYNYGTLHPTPKFMFCLFVCKKTKAPVPVAARSKA